MNNKPESKPESKPDELEGLVLSLQDYKEQDGIIKLAMPDQIASVYARGVLKETSKNRRLTQPFSKVRLIFAPQYSRDMYFLLHGDVLWEDQGIQKDLSLQAAAFVIRDIVQASGTNPWIYENLEGCWKAWSQGDLAKGNLYACLVLAGILEKEGISPNVDSCALCGATTGIEALAIEEGGFLCRSCRQDRYPRQSKEDLLKIRALIRARAQHRDWLADHFTYTLEDLCFLARWYTWHTERKLPSLQFLETIQNMEKRQKH